MCSTLQYTLPPPSQAPAPGKTLSKNRRHCRPTMVEAALEPAVKKNPPLSPPPPPSDADAGGLLSPRKRAKSHGVFVRAGRVYDGENGKTCHQCRQKTMDFSASCKNERGGKPCTTHFCHKCLLNRYGEIAEAAMASGGWSCPKCRGICNCSVCMKKRGQPPTGILSPTARSSGFSSVSEMLRLSWRVEEVVVAASSVAAGSSPDDPIDVDEVLEVAWRREEERDREVEVLKAEIAALQAEIEQLEGPQG